MYPTYSLVVKFSYSIHIPDSKPTTVLTANHKLRIHNPITLRSGPHWNKLATPPRGIEYTIVYFHQCI